jgi:hypothetical protein
LILPADCFDPTFPRWTLERSDQHFLFGLWPIFQTSACSRPALPDENFHDLPRKNRAEDRGWKIEDRNHPSSILYLRLVSEMPHSGKNHRDAMLIGCADDLFVFGRVAGLNHGFGAAIGRFVDSTTKGVDG